MTRILLASLVCVFLSTGNAFAQSQFQSTDRWSQTATDGLGLRQGDPTTITWGFVADGTTIEAAFPGIGETTGPSNLIDFLDTNFNSGGGTGADLTNRSWFSIFENSFNRWSEISGLTYAYEANDDGNNINGVVSASTRGSLGVRADVRISGHTINGAGGTLGYNYFPDAGDMVLDTTDLAFFGSTNNSFRNFRNVIMHEHGHGLGLEHVQSSDATFLMEGSIASNAPFEGPQFDDILGAHRLYGDALEKNGGNESSISATDLGILTGSGLIIGADGNQGSTPQFVTAEQTDFVSIDDNADIDVFEFDVTSTTDITLVLTPVGPTYLQGPEGGSESQLDTTRLADINLELLDSDGTTVLNFSASSQLGAIETINANVDAGTYYARVSSLTNDVQMYQLSITMIPEPTAAVMSCLIVVMIGTGIRHRKKHASNS